MAFDFSGKAIVVTGGAAGLGKAFCEDLVTRGARIGVADIEGEKAKAVAAEIGPSAWGFQVDVSDRGSVEALADEAWTAFGRVDGIFNNAGIGAGRDILRTAEEDLDWVLGVNLKGVWYGCQVFGQRFRDQGGPALIVNTGSEHSLGVPHLRGGAYTASKHAVHGLSDILRREVPEDIQVSLFCPGIVATEIWNSGRNRPANIGGPSEA
ncbi:MAG: SDR family NAD(P)-dependent oxidoreductase, partial [Hyphomonadaceae bacterium]